MARIYTIVSFQEAGSDEADELCEKLCDLGIAHWGRQPNEDDDVPYLVLSGQLEDPPPDDLDEWLRGLTEYFGADRVVFAKTQDML